MHAFAENFILCRTVDDWVRQLRMAADSRCVAEDYETRPAADVILHRESALRPEQGALICGVSLAWRDETQRMQSCYVAIRHDPRYAGYSQPDPMKCIEAFDDWCRARTVEKLRIVHNLRMEYSQMLRDRIAWPLKGQGHDTMIAHRVLSRGVGPRELIGLKELRNRLLRGRGYEDSKNEMDAWLKARGFAKGADIWRSPPDVAGPYAAGDTCSTLELWESVENEVYQPATDWWWVRGAPVISPRLTDKPLADLYELEVETAIQAVQTTHRGSPFDFAKAKQRTDGAVALRDACDDWVLAHAPAELLDWAAMRRVTDKETKVVTWKPGPTFNPGSTTQAKRLLFGDGVSPGLGLTVDTSRMSSKFREEMSATQQERVLADPALVISYAALDISAMAHYAEVYPEHADLLLMIGARRKMGTVLCWSRENPRRYGLHAVPDAWWRDDPDAWLLDLIFHQLGTVQTFSGRMSSSAYNGQNVSADKALQIAARVVELLREYLESVRFAHLLTLVELRGKKLDFGVRCLFLTRPGHNGRPIDLSQIEVRVFAGLTRNKMLCDGYGAQPTPEEIRVELDLIRRIGHNELDIDGYLGKCVLDPLRHWKGVPIDAHSLVGSMTTDDREVALMGLGRRAFDEVMQLCSGDEERAVLAVIDGRRGFSNPHLRDLSREDVLRIIAGCDAAERGDAEVLVKILVAMRKGKKSITFGIMYGMGVLKLSRALGKTMEETREFLDEKYFRAFPEARAIPKDMAAKIVARGCKDNGWVGWMQNPSGRKFYFPLVWEHGWDYKNAACPAKGQKIALTKGRPGCRYCKPAAQGAYVAVNRFIQGDASRLYKTGWVRTAELLEMPAFGGGELDYITRRPTRQSLAERSIHDETIYSLDRSIDNALTDYCLRSLMTLLDKVGVNTQTSSERFVTSWAEKEEVKYNSLREAA